MESIFVFALVAFSWLQFLILFPVTTLSDVFASWSSVVGDPDLVISIGDPDLVSDRFSGYK
jgi:hypothetical protein